MKYSDIREPIGFPGIAPDQKGSIVVRTRFLIAAVLFPAVLWPGQGLAQEIVDYDELNGLLAYPEEYFPSNAAEPSGSGIYSNEYVDDTRGDVSRWESQEGRRTISRETWNDEATGEGTARIGIGRNF